MVFELWDHQTSNRLGVFKTEEDALSAVLSIVDGYKSPRASNSA